MTFASVHRVCKHSTANSQPIHRHHIANSSQFPIPHAICLTKDVPIECKVYLWRIPAAATEQATDKGFRNGVFRTTPGKSTAGDEGHSQDLHPRQALLL